MTRAPAFCGLVLLLAGCGQQEVPSVDALSAHPARLRLLKEQCRAGQLDGALCAQVVKADLRRFFSGKAGPDEVVRLVGRVRRAVAVPLSLHLHGSRERARAARVSGLGRRRRPLSRRGQPRPGHPLP